MKLSVVIADDDISTCNGIKNVIVSKFPDFTIEGIFYDGETLYNFILNNNVDIIVSDINLPGKSGLDISKYINSKHLSTYIILITGYLKFEYAKQAIDNKVSYFLTKPFSIPELINKLQLIDEEIEKSVTQSFKSSNAYINNWKLLRNNFQNVYNGQLFDREIISDAPISNKANFQNTKCALFTIQYDDNIINNKNKTLIDDIIEHGEIDSPFITSFFLCNDKNKFVFLTLYANVIPDSYYIDLSRLIKLKHKVLLKYNVDYFDTLKIFLEFCKAKKVSNDFIDVLNNEYVSTDEYIDKNFNSLSLNELNYVFKNIITYFNLKNEECKFFDKNNAFLKLKNISHHIIDSSNDTKIVSLAQSYIYKNYNNCNLSMFDVSSKLDISPNYLSKLFKNIKGTNYINYLTEVRISHAKDLLENTHMCIEDIGNAVGYNQDAYFRKVFKKQTGVTPSYYRLHKKIEAEND